MNPTPAPAKPTMVQGPQPNRSSAKRFIAKVANFGFRNARWEAGDIVDATPEEAASIPHHFEPLGPATDGSDDPAIKDAIAKADRVDHVRSNQKRKTYDEVRPTLVGGAAVAIDKKPGQIQKEAIDRKNEERANDARKGRKATQPLPVSATPLVKPAVPLTGKPGTRSLFGPKK